MKIKTNILIWIKIEKVFATPSGLVGKYKRFGDTYEYSRHIREGRQTLSTSYRIYDVLRHHGPRVGDKDGLRDVGDL